MTTERRYTLTVTEPQAALIRDACELLARVNMGQIDAVVYEASLRIENHFDLHAAHAIATQLADVIWPDGVQKHCARSNTAWDMYQVVRHRIAHDHLAPGAQPDRTCVIYREPRRTGPEPLAAIEEVRDA